MAPIKYTSDGKKVSVIGKLNAQESIVQEIFITQDGAEIPSGENFVVKSLHDAPAVSWKENEIKKLEKRYEDESKEWGRRIATMRDTCNREYNFLSAMINNTKLTAGNWNHECFKQMELFLAGQVKFLVSETYCCYEIIHFADTMEDREDNVKLITLFGKSNGILTWKLNNYRDGSGTNRTVFPVTSFEEAKALLEKLILNQITELNVVNDGMVKAKKLYGLSVPTEDQISQKNLKTIEQKNKVIEKLKLDILTIESEIAAISSGNDKKAAQ